jgi:hypothetical protein
MTREYAPPLPEIDTTQSTTSSPSGREYAPDEPRITAGRKETPDVSPEQKLSAFGRGIVTGIPGGAGELESLLTQTAPQLMGFQGAASTLFPRTADYERYIQSGEKALGLKPGVDPRVEGYQKGGEFIGEFLTPATAVSKPIVSAYKLSRGKPLEEALGVLKTSAEDLASKAAATSAQTESEAVRATYEQARRRGINLTDAELKRAAEVQATREDSARKFSDLGAPKPVAELGDEMQRRLTGTKFTRGSNRSRQAEQDSAKYFEEANAKNWGLSGERAGIMTDLQDIMRSAKYTPDEKRLAQSMYDELRTTTGIEGVEKIFRKYNEASKGAPKEGYDAVMQQFSGDVSKKLSEALNSFAPSRVEFRNTYRELSSPLDAYETQFGKQALAEEKAVPGQVQMMPTDYPKQYFQNRDTIRVLREQLAGDEAAVRKFANQHVVNELQGKNADQAKEWLKTNSAWVNEVEGLNGRVARYVTGLEQAELKAGTLEQQVKKIQERKTRLGEVRQTIEDRISNAAVKDREAIALNSKFLQTIKDASEMPRQAKSFVKDLFSRKVINEQEFDTFMKEIQNIETMSKTKEDAARRLKRYLGGSLAVSAGTFPIRRALGI